MDILSKQLLQDPLDLGVKFNGSFPYIPNGSAKLNSLPISVAFEYNRVEPWNSVISLCSCDTTNGIAIWTQDTGTGSTFTDVAIFSNISGANKLSRCRVSNSALPLGNHKIVICIPNSLDSGFIKVIMYIDGIATGIYTKISGTLTSTEIGIPTGDLNILTSNFYNGIKTYAQGTTELKKYRIFNFLMDATDALYTIQDYQDGKDVPSYLLECRTISTTDPNIGASSVRTDDSTKIGWKGIGDTSTLSAAIRVTCGDWVAYLQPNYSVSPNPGVSYIDNYTLTAEEKTIVGSDYAVALSTKYYIGYEGSKAFLYNTKIFFPTSDITNTATFSFKQVIKFRCWVKPLQVGYFRVGMIYYSKVFHFTASDLNKWQQLEGTFEIPANILIYSSGCNVGMSYNVVANLGQAGIAVANFKAEYVNAIIDLDQNITNTTWTDNSANQNNATFTGDVTIIEF